LTDRHEDQIRNRLREHFGIVPVARQRLEAPALLAERPLWSTTIEHRGSGLAISPDGKLVAVAQARGNVLLFDGSSGQRLAQLPLESEDVRLQFRMTDGRLLTFDAKNILREWDAAAGRLVSEKSFASHRLDEVVISETGTLIASRDANERGAGVLDLKTGMLRWNRKMRIRASGLIALSPDGRRLAVCDGFSKTILLCDTGTGATVATLEGHAGTPNHGYFSPDGNWLISTGDDTKVLVWDGRTGELRHEYSSDSAHGSGIAFTGDSRSFVACSEHGRFAVFDCATGFAQSGYKVSGNWVAAMAVSADGARLFMLVITSDGGDRVDCWDLTKGR
jgi:WD40 repeat protein